MPDEPKEDVVQSRVKEALDKYREQIRAEEQEKLKEQFETNLLSQIEGIKKEALEAAKSEIMSDPRIADAKKKLEAVQSVVGTVEETVAIKELQAQVTSLTGQVGELQKKLSESEQDKAQIATLARKAAIDRLLEKRASGVSNPDLFRELVKGKISEGDDTETIKRKVDEAMALVKKFDQKLEQKAVEVKDLSAKIKEEVQKQGNESKAQITQLENELKALKESNTRFKSLAEKSMEVGKRGYLEALKTEIVESKTSGHPARLRIRRLVEQANLGSREDIEKFVEDALRAEGKNSALYESVRNSVKKGEGAVLNEDGTEKKTPLSEQSGSESKIFGVPTSTMRRLAGIK